MLEFCGYNKNVQFDVKCRYQMSSSILSLVIDKTVNEPKYLQLQRQIEQLIQVGRLLPEEKIPSSRALTKELGISRTSVLKAIDNLIAEGVLVSFAKKGVYVARFQPRVDSIKTEPQNKYCKDAQTQHLTFDSGADVDVFPKLQWAKCLKKAWVTLPNEFMEGGYQSGIPELKQQICEYLRQLRGLDCEPGQIIVTAGSRDALSIITNALLNKANNRVWLEQACYPQIPKLMQLLQADIQSLPIDNEGGQLPRSEGLHNQNSGGIAILTPCRQYPLGVAMSGMRRQQWLDWALNSANNAPNWIVEDDYDNEFVYQGRVNVPLMQQDNSERVFFVGSFSKVLFRGLRLGFVVSPMSMSEEIQNSQRSLGASSSVAMQPALVEFMRNGSFVSHLRKMRRHYVLKRDLIIRLLRPVAEFYDWQNVSGGMHVCVLLKPQYAKREQAIFELARSQGVALNCLSSHYIAHPQRAGFIIGFTKLSAELLEQTMEIFIDATNQVCHSGPS